MYIIQLHYFVFSEVRCWESICNSEFCVKENLDVCYCSYLCASLFSSPLTFQMPQYRIQNSFGIKAKGDRKITHWYVLLNNCADREISKCVFSKWRGKFLQVSQLEKGGFYFIFFFSETPHGNILFWDVLNSVAKLNNKHSWMKCFFFSKIALAQFVVIVKILMSSEIVYVVFFSQ